MAADREAPLDLDGLAELARAATPGPWYVKDLYFGGPVVWRGTAFEDQSGYEAIANFNQLYGAAPNAAFIAAANPATVLRLIDLARLGEQTRRALNEVMAVNHSPYLGSDGVRLCQCAIHEDARSALAAKLRESGT